MKEWNRHDNTKFNTYTRLNGMHHVENGYNFTKQEEDHNIKKENILIDYSISNPTLNEKNQIENEFDHNNEIKEIKIKNWITML